MRAVATTILLVSTLSRARADTQADAQAALERGVAAYRANDLLVAEREMTAAKTLSPESPNPYRWLAIIERDLDNCRDAMVHVEGFLARVPADDKRVAEMIDLRTKCVLVARAATVPKPPPPPPPDEGHWWLWAGLGATLGIAAGVITYFVVTDDRPQLSPITCMPGTGCQ